MKNITILFLFIVNISFLFALNNAPEVTNVTFTQRIDGSFIVDVYYDVTDSDSNGMNISMQVSNNAGISWDFPCTNISGDIGNYILSGNRKHIIWDFGAEHPGIEGDEFQIKIIADDEPVTDIDGNVYRIVKIGEQWWLAENLKVTQFRNGDSLVNVTVDSVWTDVMDASYCNYNNDTSNVSVYGRLYNWYAVNDNRYIAPEGWHVPTDAEWKQLELYLGMSQSEVDDYDWRGSIEGGMMKEESLDYWESPNSGATNKCHFFALPAGYRDYYGGYFYGINFGAFFWSATESESLNYLTWYRLLSNNHSDVYRSTHYKKNGFSIRCIKD